MKHLKTQKQLNEASENLNISDVISRFSKEELKQILLKYSDFLRNNDYTFDLNTEDKWRKEFDTRNMITTQQLVELFLNDL
jgi:hypothetical protein